MSNSSDPDQAQHFVGPGPDLGLIWLKRLSVDGTSRQSVNSFTTDHVDAMAHRKNTQTIKLCPLAVYVCQYSKCMNACHLNICIKFYQL